MAFVWLPAPLMEPGRELDRLFLLSVVLMLAGMSYQLLILNEDSAWLALIFVVFCLLFTAYDRVMEQRRAPLGKP